MVFLSADRLNCGAHEKRTALAKYYRTWNGISK